MNNHSSNQAVLAAFSNYQAVLAASGFRHEFNTYYRLGEYESGPTVGFTAASLNLDLLPTKVEGRNFWALRWDIPSPVQLPGLDGFWRLAFFGVDGFPAGFSGNSAAVKWLTGHSN